MIKGRSRRGNEADRIVCSEGSIRLLTPAAAQRSRREAAFTLAEVLAALMFMAIVIPVAVDALHIASLSGEFAVRKAAATRVAERVLNESIVSTNWSSSVSGSATESGIEYRYTLNNRSWSQDSSMQLLTAEVSFNAGGRSCSVRLNTLANSTSASAGAAMTGMP